MQKVGQRWTGTSDEGLEVKGKPEEVDYPEPGLRAGQGRSWGLTRFLKSAATSRVNTAKFRKPVDSSWLFWDRWLLPKDSTASRYCSSLSTWPAKVEKETQAWL
jgi:hypothetical protein